MKNFLTLLTLFFIPHLVSAQNFVPCSGAECNACHFVEMGNSILVWLIAVLFVVFAVIMAIAGWGLVTSGGNPGAKEAAKNKFKSAIIGLIVVLAAWLLVDTIMRGLLVGNTGNISGYGIWSEVECVDQTPTERVVNRLDVLDNVPGWESNDEGQYEAGCTPTGVNSQGELDYDCTQRLQECQQSTGGGQENSDGSAVICDPPAQEAAPEVTEACSPIAPVTDPAALQLENGSRVVWTGTDPRLRTCVERFIGQVGGNVTSAYRPQSYQAHLYEVSTKACQLSRSNGTCEFAAEIEAHRASHGLPICGAVARSGSRHGSGIGVDISGINHAAVRNVAADNCLRWRNYTGDPFHYDLIPGCTCN